MFFWYCVRIHNCVIVSGYTIVSWSFFVVQTFFIFSPPARWGLLDFMSVACSSPPLLSSSSCSTATLDAQCSLSDLNHDHPRPVFPAGPQPRPSPPSVPCRTSTTTIHAQCSLPDLNREYPRQVFPAGPHVGRYGTKNVQKKVRKNVRQVCYILLANSRVCGRVTGAMPLLTLQVAKFEAISLNRWQSHWGGQRHFHFCTFGAVCKDAWDRQHLTASYYKLLEVISCWIDAWDSQHHTGFLLCITAMVAWWICDIGTFVGAFEPSSTRSRARGRMDIIIEESEAEWRTFSKPSAAMARKVAAFEKSAGGFKLAPEQLSACRWFGEAMDVALQEEENKTPLRNRAQHACLLIGAGGTGKTTIILELMLDVFCRFFPARPGEEERYMIATFSHAQSDAISNDVYRARTCHTACSYRVASLRNKHLALKTKEQEMKQRWQPKILVIQDEISLVPAAVENMMLYRSMRARQDEGLDPASYFHPGELMGHIPILLIAGDFLQIKPANEISLADNLEELIRKMPHTVQDRTPCCPRRHWWPLIQWFIWRSRSGFWMLTCQKSQQPCARARLLLLCPRITWLSCALAKSKIARKN